MEQNGDCFDEDFVLPKDNDAKTLESIGMILPYVETVEDVNKTDRSRVFVHMNNGDVYELKMEKLSKEQLKHCNNFYGTGGRLPPSHHVQKHPHAADRVGKE